MFTKLWKRAEEKDPAEGFAFNFERSRGEPLRFNGQIAAESLGCELRPAGTDEPYHCLRVYVLETSAFAVVVEFHAAESTVVTDAGVVATIGELDDFFCMHAGDHFHRMSFDESIELEDRKEREQRVLARYDLQVMDILKQLESAATQSAATQSGEQ